MRRFLMLATAVLAGGLLTACGDDPTGPESVAGTYILQTINGEELPVDFEGVVVSAGSIRLTSDGFYVLSLTMGPINETGTFWVDGSTVNFVHQAGGFVEGFFTGTISGNTLTTRRFGDTFVYRK